MGTQYFCQNKRRRQDILNHPTLNGIDYLEVLDADAPAGSPPQQTLLVRCLKALLPGELAGNNVAITGGVRVTPVKVVWAGRAADAVALFEGGRIRAVERDFLLGLASSQYMLVVRTASAGDYSTYRLSLVQSPTNPQPPANFDPILSRVDFSFKVECPSEFDCAVEPECPPEIAPEPVIDYLAKDYASFRRLMLDRISTIMPDWKERNPADLGIALVELLAYAGDYLSYYQDAVATEAYLGTSRRRVSLRRHARLLDYPMHDGCNARAWVCFEVGEDQFLQRVDVTGHRTRLLTKVPEGVVIDVDRWEKVRAAHRPEVFELMHDIMLRQAHNPIHFYTWGDEECCLPKGATQATLVNERNTLQLAAGDVLIFEEVLDPGTGLPEDADPAQRHAVRLTLVTSDIDPLYTDRSVVAIEWDEEDALPFPLCLSTVIEGQLVNNVSVARGNVALVDHGRRIAGEKVPQPEGHRRYRPRLRETDITCVVAYDHDEAIAQPAAATIGQDPRAALPAVELYGTGEVWRPQRDLLNSDRFANEFVVELENDGDVTLRFGDGVYGRASDANVQLEATYRIGNGPAGNVGSEAIAHIVTSLAGITHVCNPLPAQGGVAPETLTEVRLYAPQAFRRKERAVTEADYAEVIQRHPAVQRAVATRRWTGSWYTIFITIDRFGGRAVDAAFERELRLFLERYRLAGHDVEIDGPRYVSLDIALTVCVKPGYFPDEVKAILLQRFSKRDLPDGRRGFFHPDHFTFGQPVYLSQVIATVMGVSGVHWVDIGQAQGQPNHFQRWGELPHGEMAKGILEMNRLEIARLDNDPNAPENGKIEFFMQ